MKSEGENKIYEVYGFIEWIGESLIVGMSINDSKLNLVRFIII